MKIVIKNSNPIRFYHHPREVTIHPKSKTVKEKNMAKQSTISEFWEFLKFRKRYWLLPIVLVLFLLGALIVFSESSAVAPFIYMLF